MSGLDLLPGLDPIPNPGPDWLFHGLLVLTFFLHVLFMNLALGGTLLAAVAQLGSRGRKDDFRTALAIRMSGINSYAIAFTITTGIAPLLFAQVLYQQTFYPASILLGTAWLGLLVLLVLGYYSAYLYKFRGAPSRGSGGTLWIVLAAVLFLGVAMVQVAVNLTHSQPETWSGVAANGWAVLGDPTYVVRLLHFLFGALGLSSLVVAWWAVRRARDGEEVDRNTRIAEYGWRWALAAVLLQVVDGFLLLFLLPRRVVVPLVTEPWAAIPLGVAVFLGLGLLVMLATVRDPVARPRLVNGVLAATASILAVMAITRHEVRILYLGPFRIGPRIASDPQWLNFGLFAVLLVVALATVGWMIRAVGRNPATNEDAA